jgi:hypothetical protein
MEDHNQIKAEQPVKAEQPQVKVEPQVAAKPQVKAEPTVKAEPPVKAAPLDAVVDRWFADHFYGSIVARNVDTYNYVSNAVEELKKRLKAAPTPD